MSNKEFRTRQAPSPTGYLHLGTARQILFTTLFTKINNGQWYIRVEDTDRSRLEPAAVTNLLNTLEPLGLLPSEGVIATDKTNIDKTKLIKDGFYGVYQTGQYGPYIQSERLDLYYKYAQELIDKRLAYWSYLSAQDKQEIQKEKQLLKKPINYFRENIRRSPQFADSTLSWEELKKEAETDTEYLFASIEKGLNHPNKPALMYRIQRDDSVDCVDQLLGKTSFDLNLEEDFVVLKSDGFPTYHLAHLVDDKLMETSLVIRAQEWYPSLARHTVMFKDFWSEVPNYIHLPVILGETGNKKLSKRDGNVNMGHYLKQGYLPEAIVNYLAFLGWNPGTEKELYLEAQDFQTLSRKQRLEKLINNIAKEFSIEKLSKSSARFNIKKLDWFNREYIKMMKLDEFELESAKLRMQYSAQNNIDETTKPRIRNGGYVYIVDFNEQKAFVEICGELFNDAENIYYYLGGGLKNNESVIEGAIREVSEETENQLQLFPSDIIPLGQRLWFCSEPFELEETYDGKKFNVFVVESSLKLLNECHPEGKKSQAKWVDLPEVIETNRYTTYSIWKEFCQRNDKVLFTPTQKITLARLATILDKNRITTLSQIGLESQTITNFSPADINDVKWRKITIEESIDNLNEITEFIVNSYIEFEQDQKELFASAFTENVTDQYNQLVSKWEEKIKSWLTQKNYDTGSYLWPLRVALSGKTKSPSPFEIIALLTPNEINSRISNYKK